jgi:putative Mg2+ transporter-C (MgtC) family protein
MNQLMVNFSWMWESLRTHAPGPWVDPTLALVAVLCGIILGSERQRREKSAGLRTLSLVCLGSAVFTMLSFAFTTTTGDSGRVAAQIVTGIGFLGAGIILHGRRIVTGVTTAALIWMAAAVGMAAGAGYFMGAIALSVLVNRFMVFIFVFETRWHPDLHDVCVTIEYLLKGGIARIRLERILADYNLPDLNVGWSDMSDERGCLTLTMKLPRLHLYELLSEFADVPDVCSIQRDRCELVFPLSKK